MQNSPIAQSALPLHGRTILDCSTLLPGPFVGKLLLQKGARVLKIENPKRPDPAREMGALYGDLNAGKELVWLDLLNAEDQITFQKLVKNADGLIEGFRPKAKKKLGLDAPTLHQLNPSLCIASLVGYPETSSFKDRAGHDLNFQALTGCLSLQNEMPALPWADLFAAYESALAMLAAFDAVNRGHQCQTSVVSMSDTLTGLQSFVRNEALRTGELPKHGTTLFSGKYPCYSIYLAKDGRRVAVGAVELKFWERLCQLLDLPELTSKGYSVGLEGGQVRQKIQDQFSKHDWSVWEPRFLNADCCVEPVLNYSEAWPGMG